MALLGVGPKVVALVYEWEEERASGTKQLGGRRNMETWESRAIQG